MFSKLEIVKNKCKSPKNTESRRAKYQEYSTGFVLLFQQEATSALRVITLLAGRNFCSTSHYSSSRTAQLSLSALRVITLQAFRNFCSTSHIWRAVKLSIWFPLVGLVEQKLPFHSSSSFIIYICIYIILFIYQKGRKKKHNKEKQKKTLNFPNIAVYRNMKIICGVKITLSLHKAFHIDLTLYKARQQNHRLDVIKHIMSPLNLTICAELPIQNIPSFSMYGER